MSDAIDADWATVYRVLGRLSGRGGVLTNTHAAELCDVKPATISNWRSDNNPKIPGEARAELVARVVADHLSAAEAHELQEAWRRLRATRDEHTREAQRYGRDFTNIADAARSREPDEMVQLRLAVVADGNVFPSIASRLAARTEQDDPQAASHWRLASYVTGDRMPPYVKRTKHDDLLDRLGDAEAGTLVIISGEPRAGKTRLAVEVLDDHPTLRNRPLHEVPRRTDVNNTLANYEAALRAAAHHLETPPLVFIDDLHEHVRNPSTGTMRHSPLAGLIRQILRHSVVIATAHPWLLKNPPEAIGLSDTDQQWLNAAAIELEAVLDPDEAALADGKLTEVGDVAPDGRLGEFLGSIELLSRLIDQATAPTGHRARAAVFYGLLDEHLFEIDPPTVDRLVEAARPYLDDVVATNDELRAAVNWLLHPVAGSTTVAIATMTDGRLALDDRIVAMRLPAHSTRRTDVAATNAFRAGVTMRAIGAEAAAEAWYRRAAAEGHVTAMVNLGAMLHGLGRLEGSDGAEVWYRTAAAKGHPAGMAKLGALQREAGLVDGPDGAEAWWRKAAARGNVDAMSDLGTLLSGLGRVEGPDGAETWLRRAADEGHALAASNLGHLLSGLGRVEGPDGAETWLRRAADEGHATGMFNLGVLLSELGRVEGSDGAEAWTRRAAAQGHVSAMFNLGLLLKGLGRVEGSDGAYAWWRKAAAAGHAKAAAQLDDLG